MVDRGKGLGGEFQPSPLSLKACTGCQVPIFWPASYFLLFFHEIPSFSYFFRVLLGRRNILKYLK